jgi:hypothetical protein
VLYLKRWQILCPAGSIPIHEEIKKTMETKSAIFMAFLL